MAKNELDLQMEDYQYLPLRDVVFRTLRQAILRGELKPGERLMEVLQVEKEQIGLTLAIRGTVAACYFVQLRIAKVNLVTGTQDSSTWQNLLQADRAR